MKWLKRLGIMIIALGLSLVGYMTIMNYNVNEIGLSVLGFIKKIKGEQVDISQLENEKSQIISHQKWTSLLKKHVSHQGAVDYKGFLSDSVAFDDYLNLLSQHPPGVNWSKKDKLAYWINVYNAFTVKLIMNHYPLNSIKDISSGLPMINSPWDIKFFKIGGIDFDLNTIEHDILRKLDEPRIHFAINCASVSCPKLRHEAFEAASLEQQLDAQSKDFINNEHKNLFSKSENKISKIFSWFENDFQSAGGVSQFISRYSTSFDKQNTTSYLDYDWNLNE